MAKAPTRRLSDWIDDRFFRYIHGRNLIYNCCWEDPRIDRQLLGLQPDSTVVMITSAGCNALDYLLDGPAEIHAVDLNFRQNALLDLKLAFFKGATHADLFAAFGLGRHRGFAELLEKLAPFLPPTSLAFWREKHQYFASPGRKTFYHRGGAGQIAWILGRFLMDWGASVRNEVRRLFEAGSLTEQEALFERLEPRLWNPLATWVASKPLAMAMMGVPRSQVDLISSGYTGGLSQYLKDKMRHVFTKVPIRDNYFWRVYLEGAYTPDCCPNYLRPEHFDTLRERASRIRTYGMSVSDFLQKHPKPYSHYILLDHQDWLAWHAPEALEEEWQLILRHSRPGTRILMRSAAADTGFLPACARDGVRFHPELTAPLHRLDRVGTYESLHLAEVV